jgi:glycosyltransferase involved in cell wall biosynthesis
MVGVPAFWKWVSGPSVLTICGGDPRHSLPDPGISTILFSEEQRSFLLDRGLVDPGRVAVIPNRIEMDRWFDEVGDLPADLQRLVDGPGKKVLMTGRLAAAKSEGAVRVLEAVEQLGREEEGFVLLLVGGGDGLEALRRRVESHRGTPLEGRVHLPGEVLRARELVPFADICVGVGRSIFEGMVCGKPCVVVGPNGYAGTVAENDVEEIARVNFSGRNAGSEVPTAELAAALGRLLEDEDHARRVGEFGRQWAQQNLDVREGARRYEAFYEGVLSRPVDDTPQAVNDYERRLSWRLRRQRLGMGLRRVWRMLSRGQGSAP